MSILLIIEEIGELNSSAAITNWNLAKILGKSHDHADLLTLDNISVKLKNEWKFGNIFTHEKDNLTSFQNKISKFPKLLAIIQILNGNNFEHQNRIQSIRHFLNNSEVVYDKIILLSGGFGFTPHQSITKIKRSNTKNFIGVFHDPYPSSSYPIPYQSGSRILDFFRRKNIQNVLNKLDFIIFPSQRLYEWYLRDYKIQKHKVKIIPHAVEFNELDSKETLKSDFLNITHAGTLLKQRDPNSFLETFESIKKNTQLNFYGPINADLSKKIMHFNDCENINIVNKRIPYFNAKSKLKESDFLLLIEADAENNPFLPTKFVDYVCMQLPIIILSSKQSEITRLVGKEYPYISELNDKETIHRILSKKIFDTKEKEKSLQILNTLQYYFSEENIVNSYISV